MKKAALTIGIILVVIGLFQGIRYFFEYNHLTLYGKGYVWGSFLLIVVGLVLTYLGLKPNKTTS